MNTAEKIKYLLDNSAVTNLFASVIHRNKTATAEIRLLDMMKANTFPDDVYDWLIATYPVDSPRPKLNGPQLSKEEFYTKVTEEYNDLKKYKNSQNSRNRSASGNTVAGNAVRKYSSNGSGNNRRTSRKNGRKSRNNRKNRKNTRKNTRKNRKNE